MDTHNHPTKASSTSSFSEKKDERKVIIEVRNLSAAYDGRTVLHDVNLDVYEHDFLGIIGPNGGGKTTLIKCILGLLKPTAGKIIYHDTCKPQQTAEDCQFSMGYLPQYNTIDRKFPISVEEVILSGLSSKKSLIGRFTSEHREKVREAIARMGLEGLEHRAIGQLSGGQLQRALLGRAIVSDPSIYRQAFRSTPLQTSGGNKQRMRHNPRQPRHRYSITTSEIHCLRKRNTGLSSRYGCHYRVAGT